MLHSQLCSAASLRSPELRAWAQRLRPLWAAGPADPRQLMVHRKMWEWLFVAEALRERGLLAPGHAGLGFGVGQEPLVALFAAEGCDVVATDQPADQATASGWTASETEWAAGLESLNTGGLCRPEEFERRVRYRAVDMTAIPDDLRGFDFTWSSCALEHLGSLGAGAEFVVRQMDCLRPGGTAVHTTEYILRRIRNEMRAAGIPVEFSKGEAGRGQHEVNVTYAESLETADRHLVFKNGIKEIAAQEGRAATFMAKWTMDDVGSSCHVHTSLWDAESGDPLMADASHPSGLSSLGRRFLAGQLRGARQLAWCAAPTVNSYRRYVPGSWAPTAAVWGEDNRTCGFRVVGHGPGRRVESRIPGADVNPYLVLASSIAAGLYGIDHELDPGDPYPRNAYEATDVPRIPATLVEAIDELRSSKVALEAFGDDVHHHLLNTAEQEWAACNRHVSDWELARNFERI